MDSARPLDAWGLTTPEALRDQAFAQTVGVLASSEGPMSVTLAVAPGGAPLSPLAETVWERDTNRRPAPARRGTGFHSSTSGRTRESAIDEGTFRRELSTFMVK